jgi:hypothetical protein
VGAGRAGGGDDPVGALAAQPVRRRELAVEVPQVADAGQRGELVHHHVGPGVGDRVGHRRPLECVGHRDPRSGRLEAGRPGGVARHRHHLVAPRQQLGHQPPAQGAGRPRHEDPHGSCLLGRHRVHALRTRRRCGV